MTTQALKFPNLMTNLNRHPPYSSQIVLCAKLTPTEWFDNQIKFYNEADSNRYYSERIRNDAAKVMREAERNIQNNQCNTSRRLGERINDVTYWRNKISSELNEQLQEIEKLQNCRITLEKALQDLKNPIYIIKECLYERETRKESELIYDEAEKSLLQEIEYLQNSQKKLEVCLNKSKDQLRNCKISQNQLEIDLKNKEYALGIDMYCHQICNKSKGLHYYSEIQKYNSCFSKLDTWVETTNQIIQKSQRERSKSSQLRIDSENLINQITFEIWDLWKTSNNALSQRCSDLLEAKLKLKQYLHKIQQEIFYVESNLELLHKAIMDKNYALKVVHTRLEARSHRPNIELCRDTVYISLQNEIKDIHRQVEQMYNSLNDTEIQHKKLIQTRKSLERDLALKMDAIYIDKEKVCGLRRAYPINAMFRF